MFILKTVKSHGSDESHDIFSLFTLNIQKNSICSRFYKKVQKTAINRVCSHYDNVNTSYWLDNSINLSMLLILPALNFSVTP